MEVGRLGVKFGIEPPTLIKLEMDIEEEIAEPEPEPEPEPAPVPQPKPKGVSFLDEQVTYSKHFISLKHFSDSYPPDGSG